jgi:tRNA dimethylallyltransferase
MLIYMSTQIIKRPFVLIIYGPTGVGKTDVSLSIAHNISSEIINMDIGQFYTPFSIGTAKPNWENAPVTHHLFDIINNPCSLTVVEYRAVVQQKIHDIIKRGNLPILVGGSAFYLHALLFPLYEALNDTPTYVSTNESDHVWNILSAIDPQRAKQIDPSDSYRIERALDIWRKTGKTPTSFLPYYNPIADYILMYAIRDTPELNKRINDRVISMVQQGWIQEVQQLIGTPWESFIRKKKLIGYNEIIDFLKGKQDEISKNHMIEIIRNKTRQYAKRQRTFWRKLEREVSHQSNYQGEYIGCLESVNLTNTDFRLYINELLKRLSCIGKKNE